MFVLSNARNLAVLVLTTLLSACLCLAADVPKPLLRFEKHVLAKGLDPKTHKPCDGVNLAEGCCIADVNRDGKPDIIAGPNWYEAPDWKPHLIREMKPTGPGDEYFGTNGDHAIDLNGDGYLDVISASWFSPDVQWFENPGKAGLAENRPWKAHLVVTGYSECEGTIFQDVDGDGVPELIINRWNDKLPVTVVKITPGKHGDSPTFKAYDIGESAGHGAGVGDVNGDGRPDILVGHGWYENPGGKNPLASKWKFHKAFDVAHVSLPFLVGDVNGDGKADVIIAHAHDYGLWWFEQGPVKNGEITWTKHEIDKTFSQFHCLAWSNLARVKGRVEFITGKRWRPHNDGDPGAAEPMCLFRYFWNSRKQAFDRDTISYDDGVGTGMQICVGDLNGDKRPDIAVAGKSGTFILINKGRAQ